MGNRQTNKIVLQNRQTECFFLTKTFFDNIRQIEKKVQGEVTEGVGAISSDSSKRHDLLV